MKALNQKTTTHFARKMVLMFYAFSYTHSVIYPSSNLLSDIYAVNKQHQLRKHALQEKTRGSC